MGRNSGKKFRKMLQNIRKNFKEAKTFWIKLRESVKIILNAA